MKVAAKIISIIFHPLLMPTIGLAIIFNTKSYINYSVEQDLKQAVLILVAASTFLIPLFSSLLLLNRRYINSLEMTTKKERFIPYVITISFYIFALYMLRQVPLPSLVFNFLVASTLALIIAFIVNIKWKVSAHMIGIGGLVGAFLCVSILLQIYITHFLILSLFVSGLVGSARLYLKAHTHSQIYVGFAIGFICQLLAIYF